MRATARRRSRSSAALRAAPLLLLRDRAEQRGWSARRLPVRLLLSRRAAHPLARPALRLAKKARGFLANLVQGCVVVRTRAAQLREVAQMLASGNCTFLFCGWRRMVPPRLPAAEVAPVKPVRPDEGRQEKKERGGLRRPSARARP